MPAQFGYYHSNNELDQAQRRSDLILDDDHGREWHIVYDNSARAVIIAYPRFTAPWTPQMKHLTFPAGRGGSMPDRVAIDYTIALAENHRESDRYFDEFLQIGGKIGGVDAMAAYTLAKNGEWSKVPKVFFKEVGDPPFPDDYIKGAMAGNKWALGQSNVIPTWALPLVALEEMRKAEQRVGISQADLDKYADVEEAADPGSLGGKRVKIKKQ